MKTNARDFTRNFSTYRKAAKQGDSVEIRDREGLSYIFKLKTPTPASFADAVAHLSGIGESGVKEKTLKGYGRR